MSEPKYIVAKFIADTRRMEPVNIGVFVWNKGRVSTKFIEDAPFIEEKNIHRRWLQYWRNLANSKELLTKEGVIKRNSERFLEVLMTFQEENYALTDGGFLLESVPASETNDIAEFLFDELVAKPTDKTTEHQHEKSLSARCENVFAKSGLIDDQFFKRNLPVTCRVLGVQKDLKFNYALAGSLNSRSARPFAVFQRVDIGKDQNVISTAVMMDSMANASAVSKNHCGIMYHINGYKNDEVSQNLKILNSVGQLIDVDDEDKAIEKIRDMTS